MKMRIWTLHPRYLDRQGLLALWREGLLAQAVLLGKTKGYLHHPQLDRFRKQPDAIAAIATYLAAVHDEAVRRGYAFDAQKINKRRTLTRIAETTGQLRYEWQHLKAKLSKRNNALLSEYTGVREPLPHPLFRILSGPVRSWEKRKAESKAGRPRCLLPVQVKAPVNGQLHAASCLKACRGEGVLSGLS